MELVFKALADGSRRRMLDMLRGEPGMPVNRVAARFSMSRIGVMKHLRVLERAGLVIGRRRGRERKLYLNAAPLQMINDRWMSRYSELWAGALTRLKYAAEGFGETKQQGD